MPFKMNATILAARVGYPMFKALVRCFELIALFAFLVLMETSRVANGYGTFVVLAMAVTFYVFNEYWLPLVSS